MDQEGQVRTRKTHIGRGDTIVLDIGRQMLVVRVGGLESGVVGMGLGSYQ